MLFFWGLEQLLTVGLSLEFAHGAIYEAKAEEAGKETSMHVDQVN